MQQRTSAARAVIFGVFLLLACAGLPPALVDAQECVDCQIILKAVAEATARAATPTAIASTTVRADAPSPAGPVVHAVLYWTEGCGHCHEVLDGILPRLQQEYGPQLAVRLVEIVSMEDINAFFDTAETYGFARGKAAVPFLLIGDRALMGVDQIAAELPVLVETLLAAGGADWPVQASAKVNEMASPADDACGLSLACEAEPDATGAARRNVAETDATGWPRGWAAVLGLAAAIALGGIGFVRRRARAKSARAVSQFSDAPQCSQGDIDAN